MRTTVDRYDPFWRTALIFRGVLLAFYLVGLVLIALGLCLRTGKKVQWVCPACA